MHPPARVRATLRHIARGAVLFTATVLLTVSTLGVVGNVGDAVRASGVVLSPGPSVHFVAAFTNDDAVVNDPARDPNDTGIDPTLDKAVGACTASIDASGRVLVNVANAYPGYTCTFWVTAQNDGDVIIQRSVPTITYPPEINVSELGGSAPGVLPPGGTDTEAFVLLVYQQASEGASYPFTIQKTFTADIVGSPPGGLQEGSIGFWKNWDAHRTYTRTEIEGWLGEINVASRWLGPTTVQGMVAMIDAAGKGGAAPQSRFLAQYLALRLNERSGRQGYDVPRDIRAFDARNYLGLADPGHATLQQIIVAIESKYGTNPSKTQYNTLKDVCEALNRLEA